MKHATTPCQLSHLPGMFHSNADQESRSTLDPSDWILFTGAFKRPRRVAHGRGSYFGGVEHKIAEVCLLATATECDSRKRLLP